MPTTDLNFKISLTVIESRIRAGLTQAQLAKKVGTKQPSIARLENGAYSLPSISFLNRVARALNKKLKIWFEPVYKDISIKCLSGTTIYDNYKKR